MESMLRMALVLGIAVIAAAGAEAQQRGTGQRQQAYAQHYVGVWSLAQGTSSTWQFQNDGFEMEGRIVQPSSTMQGAGIRAGTLAFKGRIDERNLDGEVLVSIPDQAQLQRMRQICGFTAYWAPIRGTLALNHRAIDVVYMPHVLVKDGPTCRTYNPRAHREQYDRWIRQGQASWIASRNQEQTAQVVRRQ